MTTDVILEELSDETEVYVARLRLQTTEPQNAIPDVVIWMISGNKRIASCRIPASSLMFSETSRCRGKMCGKFQTIFLTPPGVEKLEDLEDQKGGAQVHLLLWLGLEQFQSEWAKEAMGGNVAVYAETYENQSCFVKWGTMHLTRPDWSDAKGKVKQPKEAFVVPDGWKWDGDWFINPELRNVRLCRRKRWVITRLRLTDPKALEKKMGKRKKAIEEGWEYARLANLPYHLTEHSLDLARRRRWHRKMVALNAGKPAVFYFEGEKKASTCEMCCM
eukprot:Em0013g75a